MAEIHGPFDSGTGANFRESEWSKMGQFWYSDGVKQGAENELLVYADNTGMQIKVSTGRAWLRGFYYENNAIKVIAVPAADPTNPRIDLAVLRLDTAADTILAVLKQGVAAGSPVAPALTQSGTVWEIALASIAVPAADSSITSDQVTDQRNYAGPVIDDEYITQDMMAEDSVGTTELEDDSVTTDKIADAAVTLEKLEDATADGQLLIGSATGDWVAALLTAGVGIGLVHTPGGIEISVLAGSPATINVQRFIANGTYTKPTNAKHWFARAVGGGGGGGGGGLYAAGQGYGGGGGAGGSYVERWGLASVLGATEPVTVGLGGTAGIGKTGADGDGTVGGAGGNSSLGTHLVAYGGGGGGRGRGSGSTSSGGGGGGGGTAGIGGVGGDDVSGVGGIPTFPATATSSDRFGGGGATGGKSSVVAGNAENGGGGGGAAGNPAAAGGSSLRGGAGGGGGGSAGGAGAAGGASNRYAIGGGGNGGAVGVNGTAGANGTDFHTGSAGGGGGGQQSGIVGAGAAGGTYGNGGGGGGGGGAQAKNGGPGAVGLVEIITICYA